jgi:hypothetical protein
MSSTLNALIETHRYKVGTDERKLTISQFHRQLNAVREAAGKPHVGRTTLLQWLGKGPKRNGVYYTCAPDDIQTARDVVKALKALKIKATVQTIWPEKWGEK